MLLNYIFIRQAKNLCLVFIVSAFVMFAENSAWAETQSSYQWPDIFFPQTIRPNGDRFLTVFEDDLIVYRVNSVDEKQGIRGVGRWDGQAWSPMGDLNHKLQVKSFCEYGNQLIAGGAYREQGSEVNPLSRWDGTEWVEFGEDIQGSVHALIQWRGLLVVGGKFQVRGFPKARNLIGWDGESWRELPTSGLGGGFNVVRALAVAGDDLIAGGLFAEVGGAASRNVARFDGEKWHSMGGGCDDVVTHLAEYNGIIFVGGRFSHAGGSPHSVLAGWDGSQWLDLGIDVKNTKDSKRFGPIRSMKVRNKRLYVCGLLGVEMQQSFPDIISWNGERWQKEPSPPFKYEGVSPVVDLEYFHGKLVVSAPGNMSHQQGDRAYYKNSIITWSDGRWQWIDWDDRSILNRAPKMIIHEGELIIGGRMGIAGPSELEAWRGGRWQLLADIPNPEGEHQFFLRGLKTAGKDLYALVEFQSASQGHQFKIFHFDGKKLRQLGGSIEVTDLGYIKMVAGTKGPLLVIQRRKSRASPNTTEVMTWEGSSWVSSGSIPPLNNIGDITISEDGLFLSTLDGTPTEGTPRIWRLFDRQWEMVWEGSSGLISFFHNDGQQLWAGVSGTKLDKDPAPPLLKWDGSRWRPKGDILVNNVSQNITSNIQSMVVFKGTPVIAARVQDAGLTKQSRSGDGVYFLQDGRWWDFTANEGGVVGMLAQGDRLWISQSVHRSKLAYNLTWYEGELVSQKSIAPNQVELWQTKADAKQKNISSAQSSQHWVSLNLDSPFLGSDLPTTRKEHLKDPNGDWGWFGSPGSSGEAKWDENPKQTLTNLLGSFDTIILNFTGKQNVRYQVSFDYRTKNKSRNSGSFKTLFGNNEKGDAYDRMYRAFPTLSADTLATEFKTARMMCLAPTDSSRMVFSIQTEDLPRGAELEVTNVQVIPIVKSNLESFDELTKIIRTHFRRLDGTGYSPAEDWPGTDEDASANVNKKMTAIAKRLMTDLRKLYNADTSLYRTGDNLKERVSSFKEFRDDIDEKLVNPGGRKTSAGWLSDNVFYLWAPVWSDLDKLVNLDYPDFSLRNLGPDTRMILDLRRQPGKFMSRWRNSSSTLVAGWMTTLAVAEALVEQPTEIFGYRGRCDVLDDSHLASYVVKDTNDEDLSHMVVSPAHSWSPRGQIVVLVNEWSHALSVLALQGRSDVVVVGQAAELFYHPNTRFFLANGYTFTLPTGILLDAHGENFQTTGVMPDVKVNWAPEKDQVLAKALEILEISLESTPSK